MPLTDVTIRNLKASDRDVKKTDEKGLYLLVRANGSKLWRMGYRFGGKQKLLAFGAYPEVSLTEARDRRDAAKTLLRQGIDPSAHKRAIVADQKASSQYTFNAFADELLVLLRRKALAETTIDKTRWMLDFARPTLGTRPLREITSPMVKQVLLKVQDKGRLDTSHRLRAVISRVFRLAQGRGVETNDPAAALKDSLELLKPVVRNYAAITEPKALGALLRAIDGFNGQPVTKAALQLSALLYQRPGELRAARWSEFDLAEGVWTIPVERMKVRRRRDGGMRNPHQVPLSRQTIEILKRLREITGHTDLVFPGYGKSVRRGGDQPIRLEPRFISENTLNGALRRLGYSHDEMTAHGFRSTASTLLNESKQFSPDAIERALAHRDEDTVRGIYNRGAYWDERVTMAQWWADYLDQLREGGKVIPIKFGGGAR